MFGWRRRSEGFEWREHVRTTILVRRRERQRRVDDVRVAAIEKVSNARDRGVEAGRNGIAFIFDYIKSAMITTGRVLWAILAHIFSTIWDWVVAIISVLAAALRLPPLPTISLPKFSLPEFKVFERRSETTQDADAQNIDAKPAPGQKRAKSADRPRPALQLSAPQWMSDIDAKSPIKANHIFTAAAALAVIYFGGPILNSATDTVTTGSISSIASTTQQDEKKLKIVATPLELKGRATVISADTIRLNGAVVRLAGIEAPEASQPCYRANGRLWNCATAARKALEKIVRGQTVICQPSDSDAAGRVTAGCAVRSSDIGATLVRAGHVFATAGFLTSTYASEEKDAQSNKRGVWQGKDVIRPQQWRDLAWEEAKQDAPDGCPIKGVVRASSRYYELPWSRGYTDIKVRENQGERWFCSEADAQAAGFELSNRS